MTVEVPENDRASAFVDDVTRRDALLLRRRPHKHWLP